MSQILQKCHKRIKYNSTLERTYCFFQIPEFVIGVPLYDINELRTYVMNSLGKDGFQLVYIEPNWSKSYALMGLWINYMKANDFNPEHIHKGMLTWIIYLKTPNLDEERKKYEGKSFAPGGVLFHYGEHSNPQLAEHSNGYLPQ